MLHTQLFDDGIELGGHMHSPSDIYASPAQKEQV